MGNINRVVVSGNLTRDPETRETQSGMYVMSFGLAVNDRRKNQATGTWEDASHFFDVTMFGDRGRTLSGILRKGMKVVVEGKLRFDSWEKDGQRHSRVDIVATDLDLPPKGDGQPAYQQPYQQPAAAQYQPQPAQPQFDPAFQNMINSQFGAPAQYPQQPGMYDAEIPF